MRPGPLEIILIIAIIIAVVVIARIIRPGRGTTRQNEEPTKDITADSTEKKTNRAYNFLSRTGIGLIIGGIIALLAAVSLFRWAFQSYVWAVVVIALGFVIVFLSRKKR